MINLCNDILNKSRRNMFPKIPTLENKISLNSLIFLKKQNPFKFYKSFYNKILKKPYKNINSYEKNFIKNNNLLSLLSKSQNNFYSVPIKYNSCSQRLINNNDYYKSFLNNEKQIKLTNSLINKKNNLNTTNTLNYKNLKKVHENLLKNKDYIFNYKMKNYKSSKNIHKKNNENNSDIKSSKANDKISRGQQTIDNINFEESSKQKEQNKSMKNLKKYENNNKSKNKTFETNKKFTIDFIKKRNKLYNKKKSYSDNKINVIWRNLRRPISMKFSSNM